MKTAFLLIVRLLQPRAASAVVLWQRRSVRDARMQPEVVAQTLAQVERSWMAEASTFVECNASAARLGSHCDKSKESFFQSCSSVMGAVVKASSGQRAVVKEYMKDVCAESVLQGAWKDNCLGFATALVQSMTGDSYTNRERIPLAEPCAKLWQLFTVDDVKRMTQESDDRVAKEEEHMVQERSEAKRKTTKLRIKRASRVQAETKRRVAEERAKSTAEEDSQEGGFENEQAHAAKDAEAKAAVDARKKTKKSKNARVAAKAANIKLKKNKARVVAEAKTQALKTKTARAAAGARKVKDEAQARVPRQAKNGAEKPVVDQAKGNGKPGARTTTAEDAQKAKRVMTSKMAASHVLKGDKPKGAPPSRARKAIAKVKLASAGSSQRALPVHTAAPSKTTAKEAVVTKVAEKAVRSNVAKK